MGEGGFEPPKPKQQIYSLPHLTALELSRIKFKKWSWWTDLNPRPADYKSAALPTELHQLIFFRRSRRLHYNTTSDVICQYLFAKKFIKNHK